MNETSYYQIRAELQEHVEELTLFAREIGCSGVEFSDVLHYSEPPTMVAVIGNPDSGTNEVVSHLIGEALDPVNGEEEGSVQVDYHFTHSVWNDPVALPDLPRATSYATNLEVLDKLSFVEVFTRDLVGVLPIDPVLQEADGILFVIDARDPWSGRTWKQYENYVESHRGRICFFLNRLECIDERDWAVLKRHLEDKIIQLSGNPIEIYLSSDDASYPEVSNLLHSTTINKAKWDSLRPLTDELRHAMNQVHDTLRAQSNWQDGARNFSHELDQDLITLRRGLDTKIRGSIDNVGHSFSDKAQAIIEQTKKTFTTSAYLKSFIKNSISFESFNTKLEEAVTETLYQELKGSGGSITRVILEHAKKFANEQPQLATQIPNFQEKLKAIPVSLEKEGVQEEVHKTMLQLDVKKIFKEQLFTIDITTNNRLKLVLLLSILSGLLGSFGLHIVGLTLLGISVVLGLFVLGLRRRAIGDFCDFLEEWFMGFGPRMKGSIEVLSARLVNQATSYYGECFTPVLNLVNEQDSEMPARNERARTLFENNRYLIQSLLG